MPTPQRRTLAILGWVIGSVVAWCGLCSLFMAAFTYLVNERGVRLPDWTVDVCNWAAVIGAVLTPVLVGLLAFRSALPGTGERHRHGFPLDPDGVTPGKSN